MQFRCNGKQISNTSKFDLDFIQKINQHINFISASFLLLRLGRWVGVWGWCGEIEIKAISASDLKLKLMLRLNLAISNVVVVVVNYRFYCRQNSVGWQREDSWWRTTEPWNWLPRVPMGADFMEVEMRPPNVKNFGLVETKLSGLKRRQNLYCYTQLILTLSKVE